MRLAIIPARGGSKRIPRKNIKEFFGKPIIAYAIEAALESGCFDSVLVSSDDSEIKEIAEQYGAKSNGRKASLSGDEVGTAEVLLDVIKWNQGVDNFCCIYPCNPFLTAKKLHFSLTEHLRTHSDSTFSAVQYGHPPQRALKITNGWADMLEPKHYPTRSQDLNPIYHDAAQFYWLNTEAFLDQQKLFMKRSTAIIVSQLDSQDIDTLEDWTLAEVKYQLWRNNSQSLS